MFRRRGPKPAQPPPRRAAERETFADLYARFAGRIHAYALQRLHDADLAADITSTVFTRALAHLDTFDDRGSPAAIEGWLLAIARNAIIDQVRADKRLTILDAATYGHDLATRHPDPASAAVPPDEREHLLDALSQLPDTQQRIVILRLQGWNGAEIAELLAMSHGAVRTAQHRAYARLRELLTAHPVATPALVPEPDHA